MPAALSKDLRWRVVMKSVLYEMDANCIAQHLDICNATVRNVLRRWRVTGNVDTSVKDWRAKGMDVLLSLVCARVQDPYSMP